MDLTTFARDTLVAGGHDAPALALAALQGDKDEVIRLLVAERRAEVLDRAAIVARDAVLGTVTRSYHALRDAIAAAIGTPSMVDDEVLIRGLQSTTEAQKAVDKRIEELELENKTLRATVVTQQARIEELDAQMDEFKAVCEQLRADFTVTDNGWEELGQEISKIVGVKWSDLPNGNDDLIEKVREMKAEFDLADVNWNALGDGIAKLFDVEWDELPNGNEDLIHKVRGLQAELRETRQRDLWARGKLAEKEAALEAAREALAARELVAAASPELKKLRDEVAALQATVFAAETREMVLRAELERARTASPTAGSSPAAPRYRVAPTASLM
jgi:predicted RNase H-like nuclease (RuvC/YqgF family)